MSISPNKKRRKNNRIKVRKKIKNPMLASSSTGNQHSQPLRQRLELKGPRVKHVCRSASVALGQPIATFPTADAKEDNEHGKNIPKTVKEIESVEKRDDITKEKEVQKHNEDNNLNLGVNMAQQSHPRRGKLQQTVSTSQFPVVRYFSDIIEGSDLSVYYIDIYSLPFADWIRVMLFHFRCIMSISYFFVYL